MKVCVIGTGGVGSVGALALQKSGKCEVTVVSRSIYNRVSQHGFDFESVDYGHIEGWFPDHISKSVEDAQHHGPFDFVVVSTKNIPEVQKTEDVIRPLIGKATVIVLLQNGIGGEETVMKAFPDAYVIGGISMIGSKSYDGKVTHTGHDHLYVGTYDTRTEAHDAMQRFCEVYGSTKSTCAVVSDLKYRRWVKLVYNSCYNTIAALTGLDVGRLQFSDLKFTLVRPAMDEIRAIAETELGQKLPEGIEEYMLDSDEGVYFEPSMLVDTKKNQPMELEVILGNPLRIAKKCGVDAPILTVIYKLLHGKQFMLLEKRKIYETPAQPYDTKTEPLYPINLS